MGWQLIIEKPEGFEMMERRSRIEQGDGVDPARSLAA